MESRKSFKHKPFINKFNREKINYPSKIDDWKKVEKNNPTIAPKEQKILPAYISNHNPTREKTIILLMIPNKEKEGCHYLAVKKKFTLLRGITSNIMEIFIVSIVFILLEQKINLNLMKNYVKIKFLWNFNTNRK